MRKSELRNIIKSIIAEAKGDKYCVIVTAVNQYAWGITGASRYCYIVAGVDKQGFDSKKEANAAFAIAKSKQRDKFKSRIDKPDTGYGAIGWFYRKPEIMTYQQFIDKSKGYPYDGSKIYL